MVNLKVSLRAGATTGPGLSGPRECHQLSPPGCQHQGGPEPLWGGNRHPVCGHGEGEVSSRGCKYLYMDLGSGGVWEENRHSRSGWTDSALGTEPKAVLELAHRVDRQEQLFYSLDSQGLGARSWVLSRYIVASLQRL